MFRFPLVRIDLATGAETPMVLEVPFEGDAPVPTANFSATGSGAGMRYETLGPYLMAVTRLDVRGKHLELTVGTEATSATLRFEVP